MIEIPLRSIAKKSNPHIKNRTDSEDEQLHALLNNFQILIKYMRKASEIAKSRKTANEASTKWAVCMLPVVGLIR